MVIIYERACVFHIGSKDVTFNGHFILAILPVLINEDK